MLVTTALILKSITFPCPPFRPPSPGSAHSPPYPSFCDPLVLPHSISHQLPSQSLPHSRHDHITPCSHYNVSLHHPPTPPCLIPIHPILIQLLHRSSRLSDHGTHYIIFHTDFLVQSSLPIPTSLLNPNTHSLISIISSPSHTLPTFKFFSFPLIPASRLRKFPLTLPNYPSSTHNKSNS